MKVIILLSVISLAFASRQCGENQHYESCGTACPLTCKNYDNPPVACVLMCNPGCHCDEGYVKTEDGRCVRPEQCPARTPQCGENQHYTLCGTACPLTCNNYDNPPKVCVLMCKIGCECDTGFVQTSDGRCVRPEECPARTGRVCGENQRFLECGTACPLTCDNYDNPPKICPAMCVSGCHCEAGYVKTRDGRCVRPEECPTRTNTNGKTCLEKPDPGMCEAYMPMFYYDAQSGTCKRFVYGRCQGNSNRYATEQECLQNCRNANRQSSASFCELPAEQGVCDAYMPRFYFDSNRGECMRFIYGGCGGNRNNFQTIDECQRACDANRQSSTSYCELPAETGLCDAYMPRFHFDSNKGECVRFIYGGCGGNRNNFRTIEECERACA